MEKKRKKISVILPVFNEEKNISILYQKLSTIFSTLHHYDYEFIFVDDGSTDNSWETIKQLAQLDNTVKGIHFSRNFGHQTAISAGYDYAHGDAIICMDSDLQHPPEVIPTMISVWQNGIDIVYVKSKDRTIDTIFKKITAKMHYLILDTISDVKIPRNVADFRLLDKKVVKIIQNTPEYSRYLRGLVAWTGFKQHILYTTFHKRKMGTTKYTLKKMLQFSFDGITSFSVFPLRLAGYIGVLTLSLSCIMSSYILYYWFKNTIHNPLFKLSIIGIYMFIGILCLLLWIIGEYVARMHEQLKGRPLYIIANTCNITRNHYEINAIPHQPSRALL